MRSFAYSWANTLVGVHHSRFRALICKCKSTVFVYVNGTQHMCIDFDGHHSGGSSFVYVNDFCYYRNCLYTHRYKFSSEKKKTGKESQYIVSRPEPVSDPPFGSDRESGCDKKLTPQEVRSPLPDCKNHGHQLLFINRFFFSPWVELIAEICNWPLILH